MRGGGLFGRDWRGRPRGGTGTAVEPSPANPPLAFRAVERTLALFVAGLSDGALTVAEGAEATATGAFTDGRTIFLPERIAHYPARAGNLGIYKTLVGHAMAQVRYGTLTLDGGLDPLRAAPDPALAAALFDLLEGRRLVARLTADFPGIGRDLTALGTETLANRPPLGTVRGQAQALDGIGRRLLDGATDPTTTLSGRSATTLRGILAALPDPVAWDTLTRADSVELTLALLGRIASLGAGQPPAPILGRSRIRLDRLRREAPPPEQHPAPPDAPRPSRQVEVAQARPALIVEGRTPLPPLPNEERERSGDQLGGRQVAVSYADSAPQFASRLVALTPEEKRGAFLYPEWDVTLGAYRPEWVALRPRRLRAAGTDWVERVLRQRHAQVQTLKRQFETLRPERLRLRRQDDGEDLDLDVIVESHVDRRLGLPPGDRPYARSREDRRDIAVAFLIDLSGSTGGYITGPDGGARVIDVAKESLVLLCEALTTLDDRHAVYGFSGSTRKGCEFFTIKDFTDSYDDEAKRRLSGLAPLAYTRLGPPIRHTTTLLHGVGARVKLLMLLSDGRPNDFDAYGGEYGIADTRKALLEARGRGIRTFCLTIDTEARDYMPRLFGPDNYVTLSNVAALPRRLPDLYRRLTIG